MAHTLNKKGWLSFLDGIRGFSALWVLAGHCAYRCGWSPSLLGSPGLAVDIFMVLSGFLMAYHYHEREKSESWNSPQSWLIFYIRRFFRIAPLYYLLLIPAFSLSQYFDSWRQFTETVFPRPYVVHYSEVDFLNILTHISFLFGLLPKYSSSTVLPDWSIGLEMQFYIVFPLIMFVLKKTSYFWVSVILFTLSFFANNLLYIPTTVFPQPSFLLLKIDFFVIGVLLASANHYRLLNPMFQKYLTFIAAIIATSKGLVVATVCIVISAILFYQKETDSLKISRIIQILQLILSNKLSDFMSKVSYSVYLVHLLVLIPAGALLASKEWYVSLSGPIRFMIIFPIVSFLTYCISYLLYKCVEKPGIELGKRLIEDEINSRIYRKNL